MPVYVVWAPAPGTPRPRVRRIAPPARQR